MFTASRQCPLRRLSLNISVLLRQRKTVALQLYYQVVSGDSVTVRIFPYGNLPAPLAIACSPIQSHSRQWYFVPLIIGLLLLSQPPDIFSLD